MASSSRRGMSWPTAWSGILPVYGLAILLDAVFPPFAVPVWIIFLFYAVRLLDGAKMAVDPWRGRPSPRRFLLPAVVGIAVEEIGVMTAGASGLLSALLGMAVGLSSAAWFVAASAPPGVREESRWLRFGLGAGVLNGLVLPALLLGPSVGSLSVPAGVALKLGLSAASVAAFYLAARAASRREPVVARKAPRG